MSMILDALSRAEKERQSENNAGVDTARYVTSSTIKEDRFKKWVLIALVANFTIILLLSLGYVWKTYMQKSSIEATVVEDEQRQILTTTANQVIKQPAIENVSDQLAPQSIDFSNVENKTKPATSLLDETKVKQSQAIKTPSKKAIKNIVKKTPPVQYSSKPLSAPILATKPTVASVTAAVERQRVAKASASDYTKLNDLPINERSQLSQYQVNVHVYDDSGQSSFVLINMVKYKQGDPLPGGGAFISAIVPEGVVIDYGNGKALIERNQ